MIRIIAGKYRHRHINQPDSKDVRPTMDRIKESIFSAIGPIDGYEVLDLFAGSGAYGLESLSRGAKHVVFVDALKLSTNAIKKTIDEIKIPSEDYDIVLDDYMKALKNLNGKIFDLFFADPPYKMKSVATKLLSTLLDLNLLKENSRVVIETLEEPIENENFQSKVYKYSDKYVTVYRRIK